MPLFRFASILLLASLISCGLKTDPRPPEDADTIGKGKIEQIPLTGNKVDDKVPAEITPKGGNK